MQAMESAFDVCTEDLFNQTVKQKEKFLLSGADLFFCKKIMKNKRKDWQKLLWNL